MQGPPCGAQEVTDRFGPILRPDSMLAQAFQDFVEMLGMLSLHDLQNTTVTAPPCRTHKTSVHHVFDQGVFEDVDLSRKHLLFADEASSLETYQAAFELCEVEPGDPAERSTGISRPMTAATCKADRSLS